MSWKTASNAVRKWRQMAFDGSKEPSYTSGMKMSGDTGSVKMPSSLLAEVQAAANEEHRTLDELLREAVERYLKDRRWRRLLVYGEQQARSLGLTGADIPRIIEEYRQEHR